MCGIVVKYIGQVRNKCELGSYVRRESSSGNGAPVRRRGLIRRTPH